MCAVWYFKLFARDFNQWYAVFVCFQRFHVNWLLRLRWRGNNISVAIFMYHSRVQSVHASQRRESAIWKNVNFTVQLQHRLSAGVAVTRKKSNRPFFLSPLSGLHQSAAAWFRLEMFRALADLPHFDGVVLWMCILVSIAEWNASCWLHESYWKPSEQTEIEGKRVETVSRERAAIKCKQIILVSRSFPAITRQHLNRPRSIKFCYNGGRRRCTLLQVANSQSSGIAYCAHWIKNSFAVRVVKGIKSNVFKETHCSV